VKLNRESWLKKRWVRKSVARKKNRKTPPQEQKSQATEWEPLYPLVRGGTKEKLVWDFRKGGKRE